MIEYNLVRSIYPEFAHDSPKDLVSFESQQYHQQQQHQHQQHQHQHNQTHHHYYQQLQKQQQQQQQQQIDELQLQLQAEHNGSEVNEQYEKFLTTTSATGTVATSGKGVSAASVFNEFNDDLLPVDWPDFLDSSNLIDNISGILLKYSEVTTSKTTTTTTISNINTNYTIFTPTTATIINNTFLPYLIGSATATISSNSISSNSGGGGGGGGVSGSDVGTGEDFQLYNLTDNWTRTCSDVYADDNESATRLEFWVCGIVLNIVGILGIIGNIISMIILSRPQMRSSINYLLIGLARCDTVLIMTSMLLFGIPSIYPHTGYFFYYYNNIYPFISPIVYPIAMIAQTSSIYMTFTVTLERYVAVCHPLRARALCTYGRARIYFFVCIIFAILYNLPRFWEVLTISYKSEHSQLMLHCVRPSLLRRNPSYISTYIHWCYLIVNYIVPFLTLAILNCLIYRQVKRANRERQRLSRSEKREIGLATMLLCVVVVFFLFNFLALVLNISEAFYNVIDHSLTKISNLLVTINSSANFLIYVIFGEKFKRIFLLIFFKRRLSRDQPDLIHYESSISNNGDGTLSNHRSSGRFSRHGTQRSTTTYLTTNNSSATNTMNSVRLTQSTTTGVVKIKRNRAPSPGPIVYYPARNAAQRSNTNSIIANNNNNTNNNNSTITSAIDCDWVDAKNFQMTSGF